MKTIHARLRASLVAVLLATVASIGIAGCNLQGPTAPDGASSKRAAPVKADPNRGKSLNALAD